jgi:4-carboxymuconolactone decarboxylase
MGNAAADQTYREVMTIDPSSATTPLEQASREFVFGVWRRPGLSRRDRRWVTLPCVAAADAPAPMEAHVYAALNSGDIELEEMLEFVLHFAVYCGWPKASNIEGHIRRQWARIQQERGLAAAPWPPLDNGTLGENNWEKRLERGAKEFVAVNLVPAPKPDSPYTQAGILSYVFGHLWQRPGLDRRDRRIITVSCVAIDDAPIPLQSHVTSALHSGDITKQEMDELALHFSVYYGFAKGEALCATAEAAWATRPGQ